MKVLFLIGNLMRVNTLKRLNKILIINKKNSFFAILTNCKLSITNYAVIFF
jgi:hypothetical protein